PASLMTIWKTPASAIPCSLAISGATGSASHSPTRQTRKTASRYCAKATTNWERRDPYGGQQLGRQPRPSPAQCGCRKRYSGVGSLLSARDAHGRVSWIGDRRGGGDEVSSRESRDSRSRSDRPTRKRNCFAGIASALDLK